MERLRPCPKCGSKNIGFKYKLQEQSDLDVLLNQISYTAWYECNDCGNQGGKTSSDCSKDYIDTIVTNEEHYVKKGFVTNASFWWEHQDDDYVEFS